MTRSQRLDPLLRVTQQRQDAVAKQLAERDKALAEQQQRFDMLKEYADGYRVAPSGGTLAPAILLHAAGSNPRPGLGPARRRQAVAAHSGPAPRPRGAKKR